MIRGLKASVAVPEFDTIVSSHLRRARDTALQLTDVAAEDMIVTPLCAERNYGQLQGVPPHRLGEIEPKTFYVSIGGTEHSLNPPDGETFEQFELSEKALGDYTDYIKEGTEVSLLNFNGNPINIELPVKIKLKVTEAPPNIKGNTVSTGGKMVTLETGLKISTPLFVEVGDEIIVNTERGEYVSRA